MSNVVTYLVRASERAGGRAALIMPRGETVSFAELLDRVDRCAAGLRRAGVAPGERLVIMVPMSIDLYVTMLGALAAGAAAVFVDPWMGRRRIAQLAAFAEPSGWIGIGRSHLLRLSDRALRAMPLSVTTGRRIGPLPARRTLRELTARPGDGRVHDAGPEDPALVTFTTGSSGLPKGANRTHGFLAAQHEALGACFPYDDADVDMPMFPVFALNNLATGITTVVPGIEFRNVAAADGAAIAAQMRRHGVTTATASPPLFDRLVESGAPLPALRRAITGGAVVSLQQLRRWRRAMPETRFVVAYGSTEAEPVAHADAETLLGLAPRPGFCVGTPVPGLRTRFIRITREPVDASGGWPALEVPSGSVGELVVAGAHVGRDYFRNPDAVRAGKITDAEGVVWHRMGDTGYVGPDGRIWLVGRVHSTIMRAGEPIHAQLVEQAALADDKRIRRVAAVGMPDARLGEMVVLAVERRDGGRDDAGLGDELRARLDKAGLPCDLVHVAGRPLPVDPRHNSKIDYEALRQRL